MKNHRVTRVIVVASGRIGNAVRDEWRSLIADLSQGILSTKQLPEVTIPKDLGESDGRNDQGVQGKDEIRSGDLRQMAMVSVLVLFSCDWRKVGAPVPESECEEPQRIYPYKVRGEAMCAVVVRECSGGSAHVLRLKLRMSCI